MRWLKNFAESTGNLVYGIILTVLVLIAFIALSPTVILVTILTNLKKIILKIGKLF